MLRGNYYHYSMDLLEHPYQRPPFDISLTGVYNLRDKIVGRAELYIWGKRYARSNASVYETRELPAFADLNLHLEYRFTKVLSFFFSGNNLTASKYQLWNYYPVQRFRIMFGLPMHCKAWKKRVAHEATLFFNPYYPNMKDFDKSGSPRKV